MMSADTLETTTSEWPENVPRRSHWWLHIGKQYGGRVAWYDETRGMGKIIEEQSGRRVHFSWENIVPTSTAKMPKTGCEVLFTFGRNDWHQICALGVQLLLDPAGASNDETRPVGEEEFERRLAGIEFSSAVVRAPAATQNGAHHIPSAQVETAVEPASVTNGRVKLTDREIKIGNLLAGNASNIEIAVAIKRAQSTANKCVSTLYKKLRVRDRDDAVGVLKEWGYVG